MEKLPILLKVCKTLSKSQKVNQKQDHIMSTKRKRKKRKNLKSQKNINPNRKKEKRIVQNQNRIQIQIRLVGKFSFSSKFHH